MDMLSGLEAIGNTPSFQNKFTLQQKKGRDQDRKQTSYVFDGTSLFSRINKEINTEYFASNDFIAYRLYEILAKVFDLNVEVSDNIDLDVGRLVPVDKVLNLVVG